MTARSRILSLFFFLKEENLWWRSPSVCRHYFDPLTTCLVYLLFIFFFFLHLFLLKIYASIARGFKTTTRTKRTRRKGIIKKVPCFACTVSMFHNRANLWLVHLHTHTHWHTPLATNHRRRPGRRSGLTISHSRTRHKSRPSSLPLPLGLCPAHESSMILIC